MDDEPQEFTEGTLPPGFSVDEPDTDAEEELEDTLDESEKDSPFNEEEDEMLAYIAENSDYE